MCGRLKVVVAAAWWLFVPALAGAGEHEGGARASRVERRAVRGERPLPAGELRIYELQSVPAERVAHHIRELFSGPFVRLSVDEPTNILMVRADEASLDQVQWIVEVLEKSSREVEQAEERQVRIFPLEHTDAVRVQGMIDRLGRVVAPEIPLWAEVDRRTNSLLVSGAAKDLESVETILRKIDRPGEAAAGGRTRGQEGAKKGGRKPNKEQAPKPAGKGTKSKAKQGAGRADQEPAKSEGRKPAAAEGAKQKAGKATKRPGRGGKPQPVRAGKLRRTRPRDQGKRADDGSKKGEEEETSGKKRSPEHKL